MVNASLCCTRLPLHTPGGVPAVQEHASEESQKYKVGKFIVEKSKVLKVRLMGS